MANIGDLGPTPTFTQIANAEDLAGNKALKSRDATTLYQKSVPKGALDKISFVKLAKRAIATDIANQRSGATVVKQAVTREFGNGQLVGGQTFGERVFDRIQHQTGQNLNDAVKGRDMGLIAQTVDRIALEDQVDALEADFGVPGHGVAPANPMTGETVITILNALSTDPPAGLKARLTNLLHETLMRPGISQDDLARALNTAQPNGGLSSLSQGQVNQLMDLTQQNGTAVFSAADKVQLTETMLSHYADNSSPTGPPFRENNIASRLFAAALASADGGFGRAVGDEIYNGILAAGNGYTPQDAAVVIRNAMANATQGGHPQTQSLMDAFGQMMATRRDRAVDDAEAKLAELEADLVTGDVGEGFYEEMEKAYVAQDRALQEQALGPGNIDAFSFNAFILRSVNPALLANPDGSSRAGTPHLTDVSRALQAEVAPGGGFAAGNQFVQDIRAALNGTAEIGNLRTHLT